MAEPNQAGQRALFGLDAGVWHLCDLTVHIGVVCLLGWTAKRLGLKSGDWVELTGYRSKHVNEKLKGLNLGEGEIDNKLQIPVVVTKGVHPKAIAISNSLGHTEYTRVAQASKTGCRSSPASRS